MERIAPGALRADSDGDASEGSLLERAAELGAASALNNPAPARGRPRARASRPTARARPRPGERAGEKGDTHALFNLGRLHETGAPGVAPSDAAAPRGTGAASRGDAPAAHAAAVLLAGARAGPARPTAARRTHAAVAGPRCRGRARWLGSADAGAHAHADDARYMLGLMALKVAGRATSARPAPARDRRRNGDEAAGVLPVPPRPSGSPGGGRWDRPHPLHTDGAAALPPRPARSSRDGGGRSCCQKRAMPSLAFAALTQSVTSDGASVAPPAARPRRHRRPAAGARGGAARLMHGQSTRSRGGVGQARRRTQPRRSDVLTRDACLTRRAARGRRRRRPRSAGPARCRRRRRRPCGAHSSSARDHGTSNRDARDREERGRRRRRSRRSAAATARRARPRRRGVRLPRTTSAWRGAVAAGCAAR